MKIGYSQAVITPILDHPVYLAGFGQNRRAETVHDDLYVRALCLQAGQTTLVLAALDLIGFIRRDALDVIQRLRVLQPEVEVIIASIHNHHGPDMIGLWGRDDRTCGVDPRYMDTLKERTVATLLASLQNLKPAWLKTTCVHVPGLAKNARNPEIIDDELTLAQFAEPDGKPLVTMFAFPCHPEVLWEHNTDITSDYPGFLRGEVEAATGAPCIFFAGALGGMMTPDVRDHSFEEAEHMGRTLAKSGLQALDSVIWDPDPALMMQKREFSVRLTNILFKLAFRRKLLPDLRDQRGWITSEVNLIKIGQLWLATVPGELLPRLGLDLKASLLSAGAGIAGIIGLANDELGYILPKEDFRYPLNPLKPGRHYEETMSISKDIGPQVITAVRSLISGG